MPNFTRRDFLRHGMCAGIVAGAAPFLPGCGVEQAPIPPSSPTDAPAQVAAIKGKNLPRMVREALDAIGGIESVINPGETVFVKPNLLSAGMTPWNPILTGDCTKPEVTIAVAEECLRVGAAEVIIGDGAQVDVFDWHELTTLDASTNMADEVARLNAEYTGRTSLACLNADSPAWDAITAPYSGLGEIYVSSLVGRADRVISVPVLKTHSWTQVSLSMKNFVGVAPTSHYGGGMPWRLGLHNAPGGIEQSFLDMVAALKPDLAIIDASIGCEGDGPFVVPGLRGTTVDMMERLGRWVVLASTDLVAADATAARIIGHDAMNIEQFRMAHDQGLGQIQLDKIELIGADLDELCVEWQPALQL